MEKNHTLQIDVSLKIIDGLQYLKGYSVGKFLKKNLSTAKTTRRRNINLTLQYCSNSEKYAQCKTLGVLHTRKIINELL